jgi:hypothetical protein
MWYISQDVNIGLCEINRSIYVWTFFAGQGYRCFRRSGFTRTHHYIEVPKSFDLERQLEDIQN